MRRFASQVTATNSQAEILFSHHRKKHQVPSHVVNQNSSWSMQVFRTRRRMNQEEKEKKKVALYIDAENRINHMTQPKKGFSEKFVSGIKSTSHYFNYVWYVLVLRNVCTKYFSLFSWKDPKGKKLFSTTQILAFPGQCWLAGCFLCSYISLSVPACVPSDSMWGFCGVFFFLFEKEPSFSC